MNKSTKKQKRPQKGKREPKEINQSTKHDRKQEGQKIVRNNRGKKPNDSCCHAMSGQASSQDANPPDK